MRVIPQVQASEEKEGGGAGRKKKGGVGKQTATDTDEVAEGKMR